jgi:putative endonuclease
VIGGWGQNLRFAESACWREKRLKKWKGAWKIELIEKDNPNRGDLYPVIAMP